MATSAFKSTTKRTPIAASASSTTSDDSASSNRSSTLRRSRSLSRFSRRQPENENPSSSDARAPRGRFVNTTRGSGFPEISLDDLAINFFNSGDRGRSASRNADTSPRKGESVSQRRGRSVSRQSSRVGGGKGHVYESSGGGRVVSESNSRRRRSLSVVRCQISDSESDVDNSRHSLGHAYNKTSGIRNNQKLLSQKTSTTNSRQGLRKSSSQKDLKAYDGYSSHSSALTDDEARDVYFGKNGVEKTIRTVYAQKSAEHPSGDDVNTGLREAMRKELRHALEEMVEQVVLKSKSSPSARGNRSLDKSEMLKQNSLAEISQEQREKELVKIVKELLPDTKTNSVEKPSRGRRRSNDRGRMSNRLAEEAEKYIQDFISNVEDTTDISSIDGERSDTSSTLGGMTKSDAFQSPSESKPLPVEMDGVLLPWLQWETSNDASPPSSKKKMPSPMTLKATLLDAPQEVNSGRDGSYFSTSSHGSWSPGIVDGPSSMGGDYSGNQSGEHRRRSSNYCSNRLYDVDNYLKVQNDEEFLVERWRQQRRIDSGGLLICHRMFF